MSEMSDSWKAISVATTESVVDRAVLIDAVLDLGGRLPPVAFVSGLSGMRICSWELASRLLDLGIFVAAMPGGEAQVSMWASHSEIEEAASKFGEALRRC